MTNRTGEKEQKVCPRCGEAGVLRSHFIYTFCAPPALYWLGGEPVLPPAPTDGGEQR